MIGMFQKVGGQSKKMGAIGPRLFPSLFLGLQFVSSTSYIKPRNAVWVIMFRAEETRRVLAQSVIEL